MSSVHIINRGREVLWVIGLCIKGVRSVVSCHSEGSHTYLFSLLLALLEFGREMDRAGWHQEPGSVSRKIWPQD